MSLDIQCALERGVIGECYIAPGPLNRRLNEIYDAGLRPEHFTLGLARDAYRALLDVPIGTPVDTLTLLLAIERLQLSVPKTFLIECAEQASGDSLASHAGQLIKLARTRDLKAHCTRFISDADSLHDDGELKRAAESLARLAIDLTEPIRASERLDTVQLSEIPVEPFTFLWNPYVPLERITILEGDGGLGKTWISLAIVAAVTSGQPLLGESLGPSSNVVFMTAEDGLGDTIRPRLEALGAEIAKVHCVRGLFRGTKHCNFSLQDLHTLDKLCDELHPRLIVLDPIQAYLGSYVDMSKANETRPLLHALADLCARQHCAVILIRHWIKGAGKASGKGMGGMDFYAAARSVLAVAEDEDQPQTHRILAHAKMNNAAKGASMRFTISSAPGLAPALLWCGTSDKTANDLASAEPGQSDNGVMAVAREAIAGGPVDVDEAKSLFQAHGYNWRTASKALKKLGAVTERNGQRDYRIVPKLNGVHVEK